MADVQPQESLQPVQEAEPAAGVATDTVTQGIKRSASEEAGDGQPEAKLARLDGAAAQEPAGAQPAAALEDLLPKVEVNGAPVAVSAPVAESAPVAVPAPAAVAAAPEVKEAAAAQAQAAEAAAPAAAPAAQVPTEVAEGSNIQPAQGGGGRGGGRGRGRGRAGSSDVDANMAGQEPMGDASKFKMPADAIIKQEIPLQRRMASCVIGIKGQSVTKLRRESGAKIHVRPAVGASELDQVVEIEGSIESVLTCIRMVDDLLRSEDPNYKMTPKEEVTSKFYVLPEMIGPAIIGKAGTHAKHIRERTAVRIEVVSPQENSNRQQIVLHGTAERVREAYHLLLGNIRKYGPNLPAGAVPAPLPFPHRPPATTPGSGRGRGSREGGRGYAGRSTAAAQPPPPPRAGSSVRAPYSIPSRYDAPYAADPYAAADPYGRAAAPAAAYAAPAATYAVPSAYAAAEPAAPAAPPGGQVMYILQDGVLKPLTVMYQQPGAGAAAAAPAAAPQVVTGYTAASGTQAYAAPAAAPTAPSSTGGSATVLYQQPGAAATYAYAAPAAAPAAGATDTATAATAGWGVQQLVGQAVATSAAPATYTAQGQVAPQYAVAAPNTQYVQYTYPQQ